MALRVEFPIVGKNERLLTVIMNIPCAKDYDALGVIDERPTPIPVLASGTLRLNKLLARHKGFFCDSIIEQHAVFSGKMQCVV